MTRRQHDVTPALVVVPTYNERDSIARVAQRLFEAASPDVELLVVDDASPDGTAAVVQELMEGPHPIHLIERPGKLGLGTAYVMAFGWALERGYGAVVEMDADLSHDPADVKRLLDCLGEADLVVGSRYVPGGHIRNWGLFRRALSRAGNAYARVCLGFGVTDSTSGFRAYRTSLLPVLDLGRVRSEGYGFQIEMVRRAHRAGGSIVEVPITFVDRVHGASKMRGKIILEALAAVTYWGLRDRLARRPVDLRRNRP